MMNRSTLVVGIGSDHGDDQIGWRVARQLAARSDGRLDVRLARVPADLLDWLDGVSELVICDALRVPQSTAAIHRWQWPATQLRQVRWRTTHGLELPAVLELAQRLGRLPGRVVVWGIEIEDPQPGRPLSAAAKAMISRAVLQIEADMAAGDLRHA